MVNCVICGIRPAVGKGEHVWPAWFLKDADAAGAPDEQEHSVSAWRSVAKSAGTRVLVLPLSACGSILREKR